MRLLILSIGSNKMVGYKPPTMGFQPDLNLQNLADPPSQTTGEKKDNDHDND
jgi:hypothetical protein